MRAHQIFVVAIAICMQIHLSFGAGPVFNTDCNDATDPCPDGATCSTTAPTGCTCDDELFPVDSGVTLEGIELVICHGDLSLLNFILKEHNAKKSILNNDIRIFTVLFPP